MIKSPRRARPRDADRFSATDTIDATDLRAVVVLHDGVYLVRRDGALEPVLAGGHPRPGVAHSTTRSRP